MTLFKKLALGAAVSAAAVGAMVATTAPADARVFVGIGLPWIYPYYSACYYPYCGYPAYYSYPAYYGGGGWVWWHGGWHWHGHGGFHGHGHHYVHHHHASHPAGERG